MPVIQLWSVSGTENVPSVGRPDAGQSKLESLSGAFSNYMQQTTANGDQAMIQQNTAQQKNADSYNDAGGSVQCNYAQYQAKSAAQADKIADNSDTAVDSAVIEEAVQNAAEEIKDLLKEELGVNEQQIEEAMQLLGLTQADLLNPQQLTMLSMELTGTSDAGMMLFRGDFQNVMQEAAVITQDLLQDLGMTMEQLMEQVEQISQKTAGPQILAEPVQAAEAPASDMLDEPQTDIVSKPVQAEASAIDTSGMKTPQNMHAPEQNQQQTADQARVQAEEGRQTQTVQSDPAQEPLRPEQGQQTEILQPEQAVQPEEQSEQEAPLQQESPNGRETQTGPQTQSGQEAPLQQEETVQYSSTDTEFRSRGTQQEDVRTDFSVDVPQGQHIDHAPPVQNTVSQAPMPQVNVQDVIQQIVEYTRVNLTENIKSIEMQLNPENLGRVYLHISEKEGAVTAQITAQNENLKEALMQQAVILKDNLNQQGIKVDAVEVSAGAHEFENNLEKDARQQEEESRRQEEQNSRKSRRSINLNTLEDLDGISGLMSEEEVLAARIMRDNGNNVDFKA